MIICIMLKDVIYSLKLGGELLCIFAFPDYKALGILKRQFPNTSLIGLTATATSHVLKDAQKILCVEKCFTFTASFNRPNLYYEVCNFYANLLIL